jgi:hypothetical protein
LATSDAILGVGKTLVSLLDQGLDPIVSPHNVILSTPSDFKNLSPTQPTVTIFLYHVGIHGEMRNAPASASGGGQRPRLPLELRFLITPWTQVIDDAYRLVGAIAFVLSNNAQLTFGQLDGADTWAPDDTVELVLESLPVDQHYDIWEPTDLPYRLSLTYLARVVGIDSLPATQPAPVAVATFPQVTP